ncbi:MAG: hypothetical protein K6F50_01860 [Kiritimatiellae bacterium]|nr:hypothetical protein [Kiritimatiellia bacterium]
MEAKIALFASFCLSLAPVMAADPAAALAPNMSGHPQRYVAVDGGFEITNGASVAMRPLYGGHAIDCGRKPVKSVMYAGDDGSVMLSRLPGKKYKPNDGWLRFSAPGDIVARYAWGREQYAWPSAKVTLVRETSADGLLARIEGDASWTAEGEWMCLASEECGSVRYAFFAREGSEADARLARLFRENPEGRFEASAAEMQRVASVVRTRTPDRLLDAALACQCVAADALWEDPCICHGAIGWHNGQCGWRGVYSPVTLGEYGRFRKNWLLYAGAQLPSGRLPNYPWSDRRYNMAEILVDSAMLYWRDTADLAFFRDGAYETVKRHLECERSTYGVEGTALCENWLNAWNTDGKWCNGGAGTVSSSYNYRANSTMAEIARALGKADDAEFFAREAERIRKDAVALLWDGASGVFGEFRDRFGAHMLQSCPDTSSVYTPIDCGLAAPSEAKRMLAWVCREIPYRVASDGSAFLYSSNKLPPFYSTCGLYQEENLNLALACWLSGEPALGWRHLKDSLMPMARGTTAGPGAVSLQLDENLENAGHLDFGDVVAQIPRTVVEGLFGIRPDVPAGKVYVKPGFPDGWDRAEIVTPLLGYEWSRERGVEVTKNPLSLEVVVSERPRGTLPVPEPGEEKTSFGNAKAEGADLSVPPGCMLAGVDVPAFANCDLRRLHCARYTTPWNLPNFPFSKDAGRTVAPDGRSFWEGRKRTKGLVDASGAVSGMPSVPALCVSRFNEFPDRAEVPVGKRARKVFFTVATSTNPNLSWTENVRLCVKAGGRDFRLSLVPPDNCDDWLGYGSGKPYALSGCIVDLGGGAHAIRSAIDLGAEMFVESISIECVANEVIACLLSVEIAQRPGTGSKNQFRTGGYKHVFHFAHRILAKNGVHDWQTFKDLARSCKPEKD